MNAQESLFPESEQSLTERVDEEILSLILGHSGGPLGLHLTEDEKNVLRAIRYVRGLASPIPIRELQAKTDLDQRTIKEVVRGLRLNFHLPIGSSKRAGMGGYYLMISKADRDAWVKDVLDQMRAEAAVLRAAAGQQASQELIGQLSLVVQS